MENKLKMLFDYQRFDADPDLAKMIKEAESSRANIFALSDDDLDMVFAAGEMISEKDKSEDDSDKKENWAEVKYGILIWVQ